MSIDEALDMLERDHLEADIKSLLAKDRLTFYQQLKEFVRPKLQRAGVLQDVELPEKIEIKIVK